MQIYSSGSLAGTKRRANDWWWLKQGWKKGPSAPSDPPGPSRVQLEQSTPRFAPLADGADGAGGVPTPVGADGVGGVPIAPLADGGDGAGDVPIAPSADGADGGDGNPYDADGGLKTK